MLVSGPNGWPDGGWRVLASSARERPELGWADGGDGAFADGGIPDKIGVEVRLSKAERKALKRLECSMCRSRPLARGHTTTQGAVRVYVCLRVRVSVSLKGGVGRFFGAAGGGCAPDQPNAGFPRFGAANEMWHRRSSWSARRRRPAGAFAMGRPSFEGVDVSGGCWAACGRRMAGPDRLPGASLWA